MGPIIIALLVVAITIVVWWLKELKGPSVPAGLRLPPMVVGLPFIGSGLQMGSAPHDFVEQNWKSKGEIFSCIAMGARLTFLVGPDAHQIFMAHGDEDLNQEEPYKFCVPIFGPGVVYDVPLHMRIQQMRLISKSLDPAHLRKYIPQIVKETKKFFAKHWQDEGVVDLRDALSELIILTASRTLMGKEVRKTLHEKIADIYRALDEGLTPLSVMFPYLPIPRHARRDRARQEMVDIFSKIIAERRAHPDVKHDDVLQVFMDAKYRTDDGDEEGRVLNATEIAGLMIALLFAGQHTSSVTGTWTGLRILHSKDVLTRVLAEQHAVLKEGEELEWDSLQKMDLLHRCVKEALRMGPPLILLMRKTLRDFTFKDKYGDDRDDDRDWLIACLIDCVASYSPPLLFAFSLFFSPTCETRFFIPKGDVVMVPTMVSMRDPAVFANPDVFDPDRYIAPREEDKKKEYSFVGFGGGRHACMGQNFAYMQLKTIWSTLLRNYDMEPVGALPEPDFTAMVVGPHQPCMIRYRRRK